MNKDLLIYDNSKCIFRKLDSSNYNDDIVVGTVFFQRTAISAIKRKFRVCGYVLIGDDGSMYPIDIRDTEIAMLESTYNCLPLDIKLGLIEYNLHQKPERIWSHFFFSWQFMDDWNVFKDNGSFIEMCSNVIGNFDKLIFLCEEEIDIIFPENYEELCMFAQNIRRLLGLEFFDPNYKEEFNYVIDALLKGYHINMSKDDIDKYCYQMCMIANKTWRD